MRVVKIAKILGIDTQMLRKYLGEINFGIKPAEKEVTDTMAQGIIRVLSAKYNLKPKDLDEDFEQEKINEKEKKIQEEKPKENGVEKLLEKISYQEEVSKEVRAKNKALKFEQKKKEKEQRAKKYSNKKEKIKKIKIDHIDSLAQAQKTKGESRKKGKKPHKKVKILRRLTSEELSQVDAKIIAEEEKIEQELEKERFKEQKKKRSKSLGKKKEEKEQIQIKRKEGVIELPAVISVKEFAEKTGIQIPRIIEELIKNEIMATINQRIDFDTAAIIADELGIKVKKEEEDIDSEKLISQNLANLLKEENKTSLMNRPPIVTIMGHVDHGKTKLLDYIRQTNVIDKESGGITQHIGAYQVDHNNKKITFLDTPGHEAFTAMRARGAKVTDIAVLVIAADEGIKPQTIEAINHAREAGVPIIVAINKIDKAQANIDKVKGELAEQDLTPEDWGGKTITVPLSALTGEGVDNLLEMILLVADMEDFKANPSRSAIGTIIESHLDPSFGPIATVIINTGTLESRDYVVVGTTYGKIKSLKDFKGRDIKKALPSTPVRLAGFKTVPQAGEILQVARNEKSAKEKVEEITTLKKKIEEIGKVTGMEEIINRIKAGKLRYLRIVLKADTKGSLEAVRDALFKIKSEEVAPKLIHAGVGDISETDIMMAGASRGIVVGFHIKASSHVLKRAEKEGVEILIYDIIYKLTEEVTKILSGLLEPEIIDKETGRAHILKIFMSGKGKMIVGCMVEKGKIENGAHVKILRKKENEKDFQEIGEGKIISLKDNDKAVSEIKEGNECGIQFEGKLVLQEEDIIVCHKIEKKMRTL